MTRYFFDVVGHQRSELDYVGRMLLTAEEAYDAAEMMAFDLAVKLTDEVVGHEVAVSDADGRKLFSILVKESYLTAMPAEWALTGRQFAAQGGQVHHVTQLLGASDKAAIPARWQLDAFFG
jgi:hypothetical protein